MKNWFEKTFSIKKFKTLSQTIGKKAKKITWKKVLLIMGYCLLALIFVVAVLFAWFSKDLPTPDKIANMKLAISTKIYDRTGTVLLYETGDQKRTVVKSDEISPYLKDATVSVEDANFYKHHGIDLKAIASAVASKILGKTSKTRGASTITQQYVKNSFLTPDRSLSRKIKEAILSIELEFMFSKEQILTMYLNQIPYGNATAGAEAASQAYYGKSAKDISLAEAATLASIPNAPSYYSPYGTHTQKLLARRNYVLDMMVKNGKITSEQATEAKATDTLTVGKTLRPRHDTILAPHFAMYVLEQIADKYGEDVVNKQGMTIITTLDYGKQQTAQSAVTNGVPKLTKYNASNAALVAIDPKTGQILTMVGSKDYFDNSIDGQVNVADSLRQPGSSFKPIAYATAFKQPGFSPSRVLYDFTTNFGGNPPYIPHNYTNKSYGPVTMRAALTNSLNVPAVKVMGLAGIDNVLKTASDMGITSLNQRDRYGLSLVLGSGEVKPVEMAGAFSVFANGGIKHDLVSVLKITDSSGKTLYDYDNEKHDGVQALDPQIAYEISSILSDNNARSLVFGTRTALAFSDRTVAAKTGTTSDFKDAWTVGYTPSLAVAVWAGNSDATAMKSGADGSVVAAPIFHDFIVNALKGTPNEEFAKPEGIQTVTVEKYSNKLPGTYSTETTTDIFASWQVPKETDDIHKTIKVCKGTSLIAPDNAPDSLVETKVFADLHSERPSDPNWETPVRDWAAANGLAAVLPTAQCNLSTIQPTISFTNPTNNSTLAGNVTLSVNAQAPNGVTRVDYYLNDILIGETTTAPYSLSFDFGSIAGGSHKLTAKLTDNQGMTTQANITVTVNENGSSLSISQIQTKVSSTGQISATITWLTNLPADALVSYQYGSATPKTVTNSTLLVSHSITLPNLMSGQSYSYTITSKTADSESASQSGHFTTP